MADNVAITEGSGKVVASDEIQVDGSHTQGQVQFMKLVDGTLNGTGSVRVNQAAKANAMTVAPASDISDATYIGDIKFGESIIAGTNLIGKVGIDQTTPGTTNRVDIGALIPGTGATNLGKARDSALGATDTGVMALAVRDDTLTTLTPADGDYVPLRVGSTGKLHVTDANITACNTGAVVISSGTVTTVSTVTNLSQLGGTAITMDEGVHDAGCQRVTIATDDDGVLSLGIIDDWDATHASAAPADGAQVMGAAYSTALPTDVGADADAARLVTDRYGRLCTGLQPQAAKATLDNADVTTAREIVAAVATRRIFVTSLIISVDTAGNYWLEDGDATQVTGKFYLAANGGVAVTFPEGTPLNTVTQNKALNVKGSTAGNVSVTVTYYLAV